MNRIDLCFQQKKENILTLYFTAGFPHLEDTCRIAVEAQNAGADILEIGFPFSDPIADGQVIQESSKKALENGMTLTILVEQLQNIRQEVHIPLILMGYLNPVLQYGIEKFAKDCQRIGIDGLILPDMPLYEYAEKYKAIFDRYGLHCIFLVSPQTSPQRVRQIDEYSNGFVYLVSSSSTTGAKSSISEEQKAYFQRIKEYGLRNPIQIGFGISTAETFSKACQYAQGAIIGSAFIKTLAKAHHLSEEIQSFVREIKGK